MNAPNSSSRSLGADFAAAVPAGPLVPDRQCIAAAVGRPDAASVVRHHHSDRFTAATAGQLVALKEKEAALAPLLAREEESCARLQGDLERLSPYRIVPGGDQPRTAMARLTIAGCLVLTVATVVSDVMLVQSVARDVAPELANDWAWLFPMAFPVVGAIAALKVYPLLRYSASADRAKFERAFANLLVWVLPVLLLSLAWRLAGLTTDVVAAAIAGTDASLRLVVSIAAYLAQLGAQGIVGAGALIAAEKVAVDTRPSTSVPCAEHAAMQNSLEDRRRALLVRKTELGDLRAQIAALEARRNTFLAEAEAALQAEQQENDATRRHIARMRGPDRPPISSPPVNGHRGLFQTSTTN